MADGYRENQIKLSLQVWRHSQGRKYRLDGEEESARRRGPQRMLGSYVKHTELEITMAMTHPSKKSDGQRHGIGWLENILEYRSTILLLEVKYYWMFSD